VFELFTHVHCNERVQSVRWLYVNTSGSYSRGHSQSELSYECRSDSQWLPSYGYLKLNMIWSSRRISGPFMRLAALEIRCSSSPIFTLRSHTTFFAQPHGNLVRSGDGSGHSADHHDQSIGQGTAYSGTASRVDWNVGRPVTMKYICTRVLYRLNHLEFLPISFVNVQNQTCVRVTFLTGNDLRIRSWVLTLSHRTHCM
jgi:hypothetical protein